MRAAVPNRLTISGGSGALPARARHLEGLPPDVAEELADVNAAMDQHSAVQMVTQRAAAVLPMAQEARKLGIEFDPTTPGTLVLSPGW